MAYNGAGKVREYVKSLRLIPGENFRGDCPNCGGLNRFGASCGINGAVQFNCFGASCGVKGNIRESSIHIYSPQHRDSLMKLKFAPKVNPLFAYYTGSAPEFFMTDMGTIEVLDTGGYPWKPVERFDERWDLLDQYNCTAAYDHNPNKFMYDPVQNRLVFIEYSTYKSKPKLATGRSLDGQQPKWFKYESEGGVFTAQASGNGGDMEVDVFICEDAPSACSLSRFGSGVALCGTTYDRKDIEAHLAKFRAIKIKRVFICLDEDANRKALKMQKDLSSIKDLKAPVRVLMLSDDAKNLDYDELNRQIPKE